MKAVVFPTFGGPDTVTISDVDAPTPNAGQVLIAVSHAGINFAEVMFRRGQIPVDLPHVPGLEAVGTVVELGTGVDTFAVGDRVAALTLDGGGQAEFAVADARHTIRLDGPLADLDDMAVAATLCNATTAVGAIELSGRPDAGDRVLVTAAAGGVGGCLLDLLVGRDFTVVAATSSRGKLSDLAGGVDEIVEYRELAESDDYDVVFDTIGGPVRRLLRDKMRLLGRHVIMGDAAQDDTDISCDSVWFSCASVTGYNLGAVGHARPDLLRKHMTLALTHVAEGRISPRSAKVASTDVRGVHEKLEQRASTGKFVLAW